MAMTNIDAAEVLEKTAAYVTSLEKELAAANQKVAEYEARENREKAAAFSSKVKETTGKDISPELLTKIAGDENLRNLVLGVLPEPAQQMGSATKVAAQRDSDPMYSWLTSD